MNHPMELVGKKWVTQMERLKISLKESKILGSFFVNTLLGTEGDTIIGAGFPSTALVSCALISIGVTNNRSRIRFLCIVKSILLVQSVFWQF